MAAIDATVVGIALPTIGREFHSSLGALQWVVTGYTLTLASLLLMGGSLGDHYGRRRVFSVGVVWFAVSSAACALAPGTTALIVTRILQGVGAALLTPGSLAILQASFDPDDRGRAIGAWSGLGGVATAAGPLVGGYLITAASWRWIFLINVPIGALVLVVSARHVPESHDPTAGRHIDVAGAALAMVALAGLTYGLIEGPTRGWTNPWVIGMLAIGILGTVSFVLVEQASSAPILPLGVFRVRQFTVTNAVTFIVYAALGGVLFLLPVELQVVDGYTPLESGVALLPLTAVMLLLSARSGRLASRIGPRLQMSVGPVVVGAGLALLARTATDASYGTGVLPAVLVFGLGLAITVAPLTATALGTIPDERAGVASAVNNDVARVGGLIAVAVLPALSGISGSSYLHPTELSGGFRTAVFIAAWLCVAGGVVAAFGIRNPARAPAIAAGVIDGSSSVACFHCALDAAPLTTEA
jgi:EmrB/QacA subfamily drug resistance transporter